jgi:hypothetical protein
VRSYRIRFLGQTLLDEAHILGIEFHADERQPPFFCGDAFAAGPGKGHQDVAFRGGLFAGPQKTVTQGQRFLRGMVDTFPGPGSARERGDLEDITGQGPVGVGRVRGRLVALGKPAARGLTCPPRRPVQEPLGIRFAHGVAMKHLVGFPQHQDALVGPLPELERGNVFIGIVPDEPPTLDGEGNAGQDEGQMLAEAVDEHRAVGLQDAQTFPDPTVAPRQVDVQRLPVTRVAEILADVVGWVGQHYLSGFTGQRGQEKEGVATQHLLAQGQGPDPNQSTWSRAPPWACPNSQ